MRWALGLTLVLVIVLSGCSGTADDGASSTTGSTTTSADTGRSVPSSGTVSSTVTSQPTGTNASAPAPNQAPTATLKADKTSGAGPLVVNFTLGGSDPDGDNLTGTLDTGSGAKPVKVPGTANATFATAGNYTVTLRVSDGKVAANTTVVITVTAAVAGLNPACERPDAIALPNGYYIDDRGDPQGTGYVTGDGTWLYEESNGIPGLQLTNAAPDGTIPLATPDPWGVDNNCINGDTLHF